MSAMELDETPSVAPVATNSHAPNEQQQIQSTPSTVIGKKRRLSFDGETEQPERKRRKVDNDGISRSMIEKGNDETETKDNNDADEDVVMGEVQKTECGSEDFKEVVPDETVSSASPANMDVDGDAGVLSNGNKNDEGVNEQPQVEEEQPQPEQETAQQVVQDAPVAQLTPPTPAAADDADPIAAENTAEVEDTASPKRRRRRRRKSIARGKRGLDSDTEGEDTSVATAPPARVSTRKATTKRTTRKKKTATKKKTARKPAGSRRGRKSKKSKKKSRPQAPCVSLNLRSRAYDDKCKPFNSFVIIDGKKVADDLKRGHRFVVYNFVEKKIEMMANFDTYEDPLASERMNIFLHMVPPGRILICVMNDCGFWRNNGTHEALAKFGATKQKIGNRESYGLVTWTIPGCTPIFEQCKRRWKGPVEFENFLLEGDLHENLEKLMEENPEECKKWMEASLAERNAPQYIQEIEEKVKPQQEEKENAERVDDENRDVEKMAVDEDDLAEDAACDEKEREDLEDGRKAELRCAACGESGYVDRMMFCSDSCHADEESYAEVMRRDEEKRREENKHSQQAFLETTLRPFLPERGRAFHLWCAPATHVCNVWHQYLIELAEKNEMDLSDNPYMVEFARRLDGFKGLSVQHAGATSKMVEKMKENGLIDEIMEDDEKQLESSGEESEPAPTTVEEEPKFDEWNITLQDLSIFRVVYPPSFSYTCPFHMSPTLTCVCGEPVVAQRVDQVEVVDNERTVYCNSCTMCVPRTDGWLFRCPSGVECAAAEDGYDVCADCMVQKHHDSNATKGFAMCICGHSLNSFSGEECFRIRKRRLEVTKRSNFKCYSCDEKIRVNDRVFACVDDLCLWKYHLCVACYVTQNRCQLECVMENCSHGLHAVYLEDLYKVERAMEHYGKENILAMRRDGVQVKMTSALDDEQLECLWEDDDKDEKQGDETKPAQDEVDGKDVEEGDEATEKDEQAESVLKTMSKKPLKEDPKQVIKNFKFIPFRDCERCGRTLNSNQFGFLCHAHTDGLHLFCAKCALEHDLRDKAMQTAPLTAKADNDVEVVIVFIAHAGVTQPELWETWVKEFGDDRKKIGFAVQANNQEALLYGHEFVREHRIDVQRKTSWGKLAVVRAMQHSMRLTLMRFPNAKRFHFVSGSEIPVVPVQEFFDKPNRSELMIQDCTARGKWRGTRKNRKMLKNAFRFCHHAAIVLERDHMRMMAVAPIQHYFRDTDMIIEAVGAPDEFCWGTMLAGFGVDTRREIHRDCTTDFEMPVKTSRHPIEFVELDKKEMYAIVDANMKVTDRRKISLREKIQCGNWSKQSIWRQGTTFFRKVAHTVEFGDLRPWSIGPKPEDWVDPDLDYNIDPALHDGSAEYDGYDENGNLKEDPMEIDENEEDNDDDDDGEEN